MSRSCSSALSSPKNVVELTEVEVADVDVGDVDEVVDEVDFDFVDVVMLVDDVAVPVAVPCLR